MLQKVLMPKMGQTMEDGTVEKWHKKEGDEVKKGDVLLEIQTDKATMEIEASMSGVVKKLITAEGERVPCGQTIALVGDPDDDVPEDITPFLSPGLAPSASVAEQETAAETSAASAQPAPTVSAPPQGRTFASPRARRKAQENYVPLRILRGTGPNGRIVERDVLAYMERAARVRITPTARKEAYERELDILAIEGAGRLGRITVENVRKAVPASAERREPMSPMRKIVADRMSLSKREIPHFYLMLEIDMGKAVEFRTEWNNSRGPKLSFNDMIIRACAMAFQDYPRLAGRFEHDAISFSANLNVGLAVALDDGLIVPVVRNANRKGLSDIARDTADLIQRARNKRLTPDEYQGGHMTLSNLGMLDIDCFIPIINPGESVILGVGKIAERVVAIDGGIHIRPMMSASLSVDHRILDGATAAGFFKRVKDVLESPSMLD